MPEQFLQNPDLVREFGFFWLFVIGVGSALAYLLPTFKKWIEAKIESANRIEQVIANCNHALDNSTAAINNNTEALREDMADRNKVTAILIEHDKKSEIRFQHQTESLSRIESKMER